MCRWQQAGGIHLSSCISHLRLKYPTIQHVLHGHPGKNIVNSDALQCYKHVRIFRITYATNYARFGIPFVFLAPAFLVVVLSGWLLLLLMRRRQLKKERKFIQKLNRVFVL